MARPMLVGVDRATHNLLLGGYCARSIENGLHWVLDVIFREDDSRLKDRTAAENLGMLRRVAVSLLRQDDSKGSVSGKLLRAAWDDDFRLHLLNLLSGDSA